MLVVLLPQGVWRSGSALPSHGRGHWFDPSYAHVMFKIGSGSIWEMLLAYFWTFLVFALLIGTFVVFFAVLFGNIRDRWPIYDAKRKRKVILNLVAFFGTVGFLIWLGSAIQL